MMAFKSYTISQGTSDMTYKSLILRPGQGAGGSGGGLRLTGSGSSDSFSFLAPTASSSNHSMPLLRCILFSPSDILFLYELLSRERSESP